MNQAISTQEHTQFYGGKKKQLRGGQFILIGFPDQETFGEIHIENEEPDPLVPRQREELCEGP